MINLPSRYAKVLKTLSGGGMSDTVVCQDKHLNRPVVIKSLKAGVDPKRLIDELAALSAIRSKHVVQVYDVIRAQDGTVMAVVEEYLDGPEIEGQPAPKDSHDAISLVYPIACGISDIHAHGRVHRDIKPGNMKRDSEGCLKIFDFGLAKINVLGGGTENLYFSAGFTPPEAFSKNAKGQHVFTNGLDVFAFGATALSLLNAGKLPAGFFDVPPTLGGAGSDFAKLPQNLPKPVAAALNACLSADPSARPSMQDVQELLGRHLLFDKHRASLVLNGQELFLHSGNRNAKFSFGANITLSISYDGLAFRVTGVSGPVYINNMPVSVGFELPGACVIVLGGTYAPGASRGVITVSVSHPEVTL
jgi:eukaryotic-like serine/threonine-protein kinase